MERVRRGGKREEEGNSLHNRCNFFCFRPWNSSPFPLGFIAAPGTNLLGQLPYVRLPFLPVPPPLSAILSSAVRCRNCRWGAKSNY